MNKTLLKLTACALLLAVSFSLMGQRINPLTQIRLAPGTGYILKSDGTGAFQYTIDRAVNLTGAAPSGAPVTGFAPLHINTSTGAVSSWNGSAWQLVGGVPPATNLSYAGTGTTGVVSNSNGTGFTVPAATNLVAGLMTATDKSNFDVLDEALGVPPGSTSLGVFSGTTIPDGLSTKGAIQTLETALEAGSTVTNGLTGTGRPAAPIKIGGTLTESTLIDGDNFSYTINDAGVMQWETRPNAGNNSTSRLALTQSSIIGLQAEAFRSTTQSALLWLDPDAAATVLRNTNGTDITEFQITNAAATIKANVGGVSRDFSVDASGHFFNGLDQTVSTAGLEVMYINPTTREGLRGPAPSGGRGQLVLPLRGRRVPTLCQSQYQRAGSLRPLIGGWLQPIRKQPLTRVVRPTGCW
jgi:hypothetical protein